MKRKKENAIFSLTFDDNWFKDDIELITSEGARLEVLETPHKKWWKKLLQFITFGLYKAPYQYKVRLYEE